jgi:hypothetical protein
MSVQTKEARIILAIEAIRTTQKLSRRGAAAIYDVPYETLRDRMNGVTPKARSVNARSNLTTVKECDEPLLDLVLLGFSLIEGVL